MKSNFYYSLITLLLLTFSINAQTTGLRFDGTNSYATAPHNSAYDIGYGEFTLEAWINADALQSAGNYPVIMSTRGTNAYSGFMFFLGFEYQFSLQTAGVNHGTDGNSLADGQCHHVAVVRSSSPVLSLPGSPHNSPGTSLLSWYVDGQLISTTADADYNLTVPNGIIFGNDYADNLEDSWKGTIQEVRFWNIARSQSDLQNAMNDTIARTSSGLIGYWRMDDAGGQTIKDYSATNNAATLGSTPSNDVNDPSFVPACLVVTNNQTGIYFDGNDDYALIPHNNAYDVGNGNFTIEAWINADIEQTASNYPVILSNRYGNNGYSGFMFFLGVDYTLELQTQGVNHGLAGTSLNDGVCHHVAVVRSGTSLLSWYIDGVLKNTSADADYTISTTNPFIIGNDYADQLNDPFKGIIQEVRFWSVARSQSQLQNSMNAELSGNEPGLAGYWRLNDISGQVITDLSANNNAGYLGSTPSVDINDPTFAATCPLSTPAGINELASMNGNDLLVYPNPTEGTFTIHMDREMLNGSVKIFNTLGEQVYTDHFSNSITKEIELKASAGIYFLEVTRGNLRYTQKIIVSKE